ncbi:hypothetical protein [Endozoicomonas lisbonensis]|uniref:hypothetical protein n=1 Tax=Endozoicomonas lisbonensis TaxID=3120522 RepID=UPI00339584B1
MSNIQTVRAVLFTSLLFPALCSMAETPSPEDIHVSNWLAFLETSDFNHNPISCHAVVIHKNWALTTSDCVPKPLSEITIQKPSVQKIMLRFSAESNQKYDQVEVSDVRRPSTYHTSQPVLLKLKSPLNPPFPTLSFKTHSWFDGLEGRYPLWTVYYLERMKRPSHLLVSRPEINVFSHPVKIKDQSDCIPRVKGLDWKICSIPEGFGEVLSSDFQRGSVLLDENFAVTGLGYELDQKNTTMEMNYFMPLGLSPFVRFIKEHTGIDKPRETKQMKNFF